MENKLLKYKSWFQEYRWFLLIEGLLASAIFFVDLSLELGVAGGVLYVALVLVALWAKQKRYIWGAAVLGTILTVLGYWLSPPGGEFWKVAVNRFISLLLIWGTAFFCYLFKLNEETLEEVHDQLGEQFKDLAKKDAELEFVNKQLEKKLRIAPKSFRLQTCFLSRKLKKMCWPKKKLKILIND